MATLEGAAKTLQEIDELSMQNSPIHSLHPIAKLLTALVYIGVVVSFPKYDLGALLIMAIFPAILFALSGLSFGLCLYRFRVVLPIVAAVGLVNPFLDRKVILTIGALGISGGVISMITLLLKGLFCLSASYLLAATTPVDTLCRALRAIHAPKIMVSLFLLIYRYLFVLIEEVSVLSTAYHLRAPGQKGVKITAWGSFLGQLLLRGIDRSEELYDAMLLRGFQGEFYYAKAKRFDALDYLYAIIGIALLFGCRFIDLAEIIGSRLMIG